MITFAFLFLGLILGVHDVEILVEGDVAAIQLVLDSQEIVRLDGEPWEAEIDFGPDLKPHRLEAIAFDAEGGEIDRTRQLINLPRERAETAIFLEGEDPGRPESARLVWQHIEYPTAASVSFNLNGEALSLNGPDHVLLPSYDPKELQVLNSEVRFADGTQYRAELTFGGRTMFGAETELTGVALVTTGGQSTDLRSLEGRFQSGEEPLRVVGVEKAPARIVMVIDRPPFHPCVSWASLAPT